jgi:hypothetical protein
MNEISITVGTDLNEIISRLNQERNVLQTRTNNFHFEEWIFDALPDLLPKLLADIPSNVKKDTTLLAVLTVLSAIIKDYFVFYDDKKEGCQLYTYILGDPAQGKGSIAKYKDLGTLFQKELNEQYREQLNAYKLFHKEWEDNDKKGEEPQKPIRRTLFVSGNSSKASLIRDLFANEGFGLIYETETDTLYAANKSDFGGFSDILRKAFHSESLSVSRINIEEGSIEIDQVVLSVLMTSTLDQIFKLIPTYDNGLFSRFIFYILPADLEFKQVFTKSNTQRIYVLIKKISEMFKDIGLENDKRYEKEFVMTLQQQERFLIFFRFYNDSFVNNGRIHLKGNINRLGLICTRLAMLLTYFRNYTLRCDPEAEIDQPMPSISNQIECNDIDFDIALSMIQTIISHVIAVDELYKQKNPKQRESILIHSGKKHSADKKLEAIKLREQGLSYAQISQTVLNNPKLKGTIKKWVDKKQSFPVSVSETETNTPQYVDIKKALQSASVSFFDVVQMSSPTDTYNLYALLTTDDFKDLVDEVRKAKPEQQKEIKMTLPAFSASGVFIKKRRKEYLHKHSGFICIDIDQQDNLSITNFSNLKQELCKIINVAYISRSVSGKGFYLLIPISDTSLHEQYYEAVEKAFAELGICIDEKCRDVSRLRIVSYDKDYHMAEKAVILEETFLEKTDFKLFEFVDDKRFISTINAIEKQQIDITERYADWFGIGCAIANTFNEKGRSYFHAVSKFYPKYDVKATDEQYSACLKNARENSYSLGTFFYLASLHDINV